MRGRKRSNKYAFQYDVYRPLVARISQHALRWGVSAPGGGDNNVCLKVCKFVQFIQSVGFAIGAEE